MVSNDIALKLEKMLGNPAKREQILAYSAIPYQGEVEAVHRFVHGNEFNESFSENWADYLVRKVRQGQLDIRQARELLHTSYNTVSAVEYVLAQYNIKSDGRFLVVKPEFVLPEVLPKSDFENDLRLDDVDFAILQGTLRFPPSPKGLYRTRSVSECVEFVLKEMERRDNRFFKP